MNFPLLSEIARQGVCIRVDGEDLSVTQDNLTDALIDKIRDNKTGLIASLERLRGIAGDDWQDVVKHPDQLRDLIHSITTVEVRARGDIPSHYTATVYCQTCNQSVPHFPVGVTEIACCVWCLNGQPVLVAGNTQ